MAHIGTEELDQLVIVVKGHAVVFQPFPDDVRAQFGLFQRIRPGDGQLPHGFVATQVTDRHLQKFRGRSPLNAAHPHAIAAFFTQLNGGEIHHSIRGDVVFRITHFVHQLRRYRLHAHLAAGAFVFGHHKLAVAVHFQHRIADERKIVDFSPIGVVGAGALCTAFHDVSGHRARRQQMVILRRPTEFVNHRAEHQRRIGDAAANHDIRPLIQRLGDRKRTEIGVGGRNAIPDRCQRLAGIHVFQLFSGIEQLVDPVVNVIAGYGGDFDAGQTELPDDLAGGFEAGLGVDARGAGNDFHAFFHGLRQNALENLDKIRGIPGLWIAAFELLHDAHGHFGQVIHGQIVQRALA